MSQSGNDNGSGNGNNTWVREIFDFLNKHPYLILFTLGGFFLVIAVGAELAIGPFENKGGVDDSDKGILLAAAGLFFAVGIALMFRGNFVNVNRTNSATRKDTDEALKEAEETFRFLPADHQQALEPFEGLSDIAKEFSKQDRIRRRIVSWIEVYPKEEWLDEVTLHIRKSESHSQYIPPEKLQNFRSEIQEYLEILTKNLIEGEPYSPQHYGFQRSIKHPFPYIEAMQQLKEKILNSMDDSKELRQIDHNQAKQILRDFMQELINAIDS
jgi:hypothetical protein